MAPGLVGQTIERARDIPDAITSTKTNRPAVDNLFEVPMSTANR
jgi:hypothetical protein